jgi:hypothetical protein
MGPPQPAECPPDRVFCMRCGPGTALDADPQAHRPRCPRCSDESWLPALPLFVVTGASGTGKSTITGPLGNLPAGCLVVESDAILHFAALGWDTCWVHPVVPHTVTGGPAACIIARI